MDVKSLRSKFGLRVRSLRVARELTQEELAEKAKLSPEYVSQIERGKASPSFETVALVASALEVKLHSLFDFSDQKR